MSVLTFVVVWIAVSCIATPFIGAMLWRNLRAQGEPHQFIRVRDGKLAADPSRTVGRGLAARLMPMPRFRNRSLGVSELAHRSSRRSRH